jgi:arylsulfatase A-like enzyme
MLSRFCLGTFLIATLAHPSLAANAPAPPPPNVVLIVADDLGWADLGCYGSTFHRTPNLDRLAREGCRFTQAYAACPVCSPTRAALMTGKCPARLQLTDWLPGRPDRPDQRLLRPLFRQQLPLEERTLAEVLQKAGYVTAMIGKWHLGGAGFDPTRQGFDLNIAGDQTGTPLSYIAPYTRAGRTMPGLEKAPAGEYLTDRLAAEAEHVLETYAQQARPFFLYLPHYAVHIPMVAPPERIAHYPAWDETPHGRQENPVYAAMLESLDAAVGRVLARLEQLGLAERTLVVFTSDNGGEATLEGPHTPPTINAPLREGKGWLYEGGIRVPLVVRWPGRIPPRVEETPVWTPDLFATIQASAAPEDRANAEADGVDLTPLLTAGEALAPRALYWHYPHYSPQGGRPAGAIREGRWKLIEHFETGRRELFDLARDPRENTNLAEREPQQVEALAAKLTQWRSAVKALVPEANPGYTPNPQRPDGTIMLPARTADVHGVMLRYEPLPHKNTLGFWTRADDWASWEFVVRTPGGFTVTALVGCGKKSGGSRVEFRAAGQLLTLTVPETGGFQNFAPQDLGRLTFKEPGRHRLEVRAVSKPGTAVMDLRSVTLVPETRECLSMIGTSKECN